MDNIPDLTVLYPHCAVSPAERAGFIANDALWICTTAQRAMRVAEIYAREFPTLRPIGRRLRRYLADGRIFAEGFRTALLAALHEFTLIGLLPEDDESVSPFADDIRTAMLRSHGIGSVFVEEPRVEQLTPDRLERAFETALASATAPRH